MRHTLKRAFRQVDAKEQIGQECGKMLKTLRKYMSQNSDTHSVCNERLHREGEKATCCNCNPHEGCTLNKKSIVEWAKEDGLIKIKGKKK